MVSVKRAFVIVISAVLCLLVLFPAAAAGSSEKLQVRSYAVSGYSGYEAEAFLPGSEDGAVMFTMNADNVSLSGIPAELRTRSINGIEAVWCIVGSETTLPYRRIAVTMDLKADKIKLNDIGSLTFGVAVIGKADNCSGYISHTTLVTSDGEYTAETVIERPGTTKRFSIVRIDLANVSGYAEKLTFELNFEAGYPPMQLRVTRPFATEEQAPGFGYSENYAVDSLSYISEEYSDADPATGEPAMIRERRAREADGISGVGRSDILLGGRIVVSEVASGGSRLYLAVSLSDIRNASLYAGITYIEDSRDEIHWEKAVTVSGDGTFLIPVEITGTVMDLYLRFVNAEYERTFSIDSLKAMWIDSAKPVHDGIGKIKSITKESGAVRFSGSVTRDAMKDYGEGEIVFYEVTGTVQEKQKYTEIGRINLSTRFEYTCEIMATAQDSVLAKYACAVEYGGDAYEICQPRYPDAAQASDIQAPTKVGLHGASNAGVFSTNVSHVMIDVSLDELIASDGAGDQTVPLTYTAGESSRQIRLSKTVLSRLDADVDFYLSAGMKVYFRIMMKRPVESFGSMTGDGRVGIDIYGTDELSLYSSLIGYVCDRYLGIEGIVLDSSVSAIHPDMDSMPEEMYARAELARVAYNAASGKDMALKVAVDIPGDLGTSAVMFARELESIGSFPWYLMTPVTDEETYLKEIGELTDSLSRLELYRPKLMCMYAPSGESYRPDDGSGSDVFEVYRDLLDGLGDERVIFLSVDGLDAANDKEFYDTFRVASGLGDFISGYETSAPDDRRWEGSYRIWDFSDKYHSMGWIAGGGIGLLTTDYTALSDARPGADRVLRSDIYAGSGGMTGDTGGAGVIIRDFDSGLDLSYVDAVEFEFAVVPAEASGDEGDSLSVQFFMGSEDYRAEFSVPDVRYGERIRAVCSLGEYEHLDEIGYVGAEVYTGGDISFELFSVTAYSSTDGVTELERTFRGFEEETEEPGNDGRRMTVIVILSTAAVAVLTVTLVVLAVRRDREEAEKAGSRNSRRRARRRGA